MKKLTKSQKLSFIKEKASEYGLTAYRIAVGTALSEKGIKNILDGKVPNPHQSNVNTLYNYLCEYKERESRINSVNDDPETEYFGNMMKSVLPEENTGIIQHLIAREVKKELHPFLENLEETQQKIKKRLLKQGLDLDEIKDTLQIMNERIGDIRGVLVTDKNN